MDEPSLLTMWQRFKTLDLWLFVIPFLLMGISVVLIYGLTINSDGSALYQRQIVFALAGIALMLTATFVDYRSLKGWSTWIYGLGLLGLLAVKVIGKSDFGAQRWINLGFFQLQPAEIEKVIMIIVVATLLSKNAFTVPFRRFFLVLIAIFIPVAAIILQPDLGTAIVVIVTGLGILFHARITRLQGWFLTATIAFTVLLFGLSFHGVRPFNSLLKDYQKDRLASFIEPSRDPNKSGYNVLQSVIAVGSGGFSGEGLGFGSQSQLNFLPVAHADFIFAGIGEAWGLIGSWGILALYAILISRIMQAAKIAKDDFGMLICVGVIIKLLVEVIVNVGMNIRIMPVTGIPLPFLSYGGTTLLTNTLAIGLVQSIVIRYKRLTF